MTRTVEPTGRLWRFDAQLRAAIPREQDQLRADLDRAVSRCWQLGITSVTDASPDLDAVAMGMLNAVRLPTMLLGAPDGAEPVKVVLSDHNLPGFDGLRSRLAEIHASGRPVAVHAVTRAALVLLLAVLDEVGRHSRDRIEHAAVVPDPLALAGLTVVTQPAFIAERGDRYLVEVDVEDLPCLYRYASLMRSGVHVLPSSDAPYGPLEPRTVMRSAANRCTVAGHVIGADERVSMATACSGYFKDAWSRVRRVQRGSPAALVLSRRGVANDIPELVLVP